MTRLRSADGQVTVMAAVLMVFLVAMVAFVLDVGSWFRQQRISQSTVDAAALAGAQVLPNDPGSATTLASTFANKNGGVLGATITIGSKWNPNDMITVKQTKSATGFFSKVLGINTVSVHAKATAVAAIPVQTLGIAPITVNILHPQLSGAGCPCFNVPTTGAPGAFALLDLDYTDENGTVGASTLASWISQGYNNYLPLGVYFSDPGAKWNNSIIQNALISRYNSDLLFPVYDTLVGSGSNAEYHVIAWVGFHLQSVDASGTSGSLTGYFTRIIWQGIVSKSGPNSPAIPDLGVRSVALID
jgi:Flp pilus assembly protein TadG